MPRIPSSSGEAQFTFRDAIRNFEMPVEWNMPDKPRTRSGDRCKKTASIMLSQLRCLVFPTPEHNEVHIGREENTNHD